MRRHTPPLITIGLVLANLLVCGFEMAAGDPVAVCHRYGLVPERFLRTGDLLPVFASLFLHDPSALPTHLGGNMAVLLGTGLVVERALGSARFLALYLAAGVAGALLHIAVDPNTSVALVGSSGSIAGVLAVLGVMRPRLLGFVAGFAASNIWLAWSGAPGSISFGAHLGGFTAGSAAALLAYARGMHWVSPQEST